MEAVKEVTVWEGDVQANHTYLLEGDNMVAYIKFGTSEPFYFSNPIRIDKRGRKFEKLKINPFDKIEEVHVDPAIIKVQGSKGQTYTVNTEEQTCSCPGFQFRGACKHIKELVEA